MQTPTPPFTNDLTSAQAPPPLATITNTLDSVSEAPVSSAGVVQQSPEHPTPSKQHHPRKKRVSFTFWKPAVAKEEPASTPGMLPAGVAAPSNAAVGHQARVLFALLTGQTPPQRPGRLHGPSSLGAGATKLRLSSPTLSEATVSSAKFKASPAHSHKPTKAAQHQQKAIKKLKQQLLKPSEARQIVCDLKRMELPESTDIDGSAIDSMALHHAATRAFALPPLEEKEDASVTNVLAGDEITPSDPKKLQPYIILPTPSLPPTTPGGLGAIAGAKSGAFELLADASGALVRKSGSQEGFIAPFDAIGVFIYWWGFELTLPPPTLRTLAAIDNVQSTLFPFLQAVVIGGGVPELAPLIRYVSSWVQMEFGAIKSQNRGNGVVLAATWLLPVALVPRPWDFPLPSAAKSTRVGTLIN